MIGVIYLLVKDAIAKRRNGNGQKKMEDVVTKLIETVTYQNQLLKELILENRYVTKGIERIERQAERTN